MNDKLCSSRFYPSLLFVRSFVVVHVIAFYIMVTTRSSSSSSKLSPAIVVSSSKPKNIYSAVVAGSDSASTAGITSQRPKRNPRVYYHDYFESCDYDDDHGNHKRSQSSLKCDETIVDVPSTNRRSIFTRSAKTAALRKYKIYSAPEAMATTTMTTTDASPSRTVDNHSGSIRMKKQTKTENNNDFVPRRSTRNRRQVNYSDDCDRNTTDDESLDNGSVDCPSSYSIECAAEGLLNLNPDSYSETVNVSQSLCINPVSPCIRYMSRIRVSSCDCSQSYTTCYIIYNSKTRRFHLHNSHTMIEMNTNSQEQSLTTTHFLHTTYASYMRDIIEKYIMNVIVHKGVQTCVVVDYLGLVMSDTEFQDLFDEDISCGDIEALIHSKDSNQTTTRDRVFVLTVPVTYQFSTFYNTHIQDILSIISGQC